MFLENLLFVVHFIGSGKMAAALVSEFKRGLNYFTNGI